MPLLFAHDNHFLFFIFFEWVQKRLLDKTDLLMRNKAASGRERMTAIH